MCAVHKIIMVIFFIFASLLIIAMGYCSWQAVVDSPIWLLTMMGFLPSAVLTVLIGATAFNSRSIE